MHRCKVLSFHFSETKIHIKSLLERGLLQKRHNDGGKFLHPSKSQICCLLAIACLLLLKTFSYHLCLALLCHFCNISRTCARHRSSLSFGRLWHVYLNSTHIHTLLFGCSIYRLYYNRKMAYPISTNYNSWTHVYTCITQAVNHFNLSGVVCVCMPAA